MITVTKQELIDFVDAQPDDRHIDFQQFYSTEDCGCLMIHFGKEVLNIKGRFYCDNSRWMGANHALAHLHGENLIFYNIVSNSQVKTYGELKLNLYRDSR